MSATTVHTFQVEGMTCQHCVKAVTEAVKAVDASAEVKVQLNSGVVQITSDQSDDALIIAIAEAGYGAGLV
ncbi:cation transporter [Ectopseudomonas mendocina]|uniref:Cation transporter n=1 Tax=Ectopseudomonas mendocina TaxID=300 RepID=A0ABZ2RIZ8_ECTME